MFRSVLIAIDGTSHSLGILDTVKRFCDTEQHLLHVLLAVDSAYALEEFDQRLSSFDRTEYPAAAQEQLHADKIVQQAIQAFEQAGFSTTGSQEVGEPAEAIIKVAKARNSDLIVMGHRHLSRLKRMLDPSIASKVIDEASCPVLIDARHQSPRH
ncbi:universal stress protein [Pseudomonas sp. GD03858]|uniref:universal stress protein n=1 Tax=unclassified Pseudomonas TaxID=196821 RepID=UPI00244902CF|nr:MULTISPECIES: universal stress protein [unclassified Pseudomonas]MDH0650145.1 universal stress protein [Pseudomonas sp. GD03867]MDH0665292.1 universal stress protein [Pseudomonas sp. GD03858]